MAAIADVSFRVGETWRLDPTMHDSCGAVLDISAAAVKWRLALNGVTLIQLTIGAGIVLVGDGTTGECTITLTPAQQASLNIVAGFYQHECQVVLADGTVTDQFYGYLQATPSLFAA